MWILELASDGFESYPQLIAVILASMILAKMLKPLQEVSFFVQYGNIYA